ncbi:MAG: hypothetical protein GF335_02815 [Candidatus Moranbacteria bacterium]|nr:hypothetical protein [Candidatus Moranbacteria bacterium]
MKIKKSFFYAVATLIGTVVGAGIFALPYAINALGLIPSILLLFFLTVTTILNSLALLEVILRTPGNNFFCQLAKIYLGNKGKLFELVVLIFSNLGAVLAYFVIAGSFLNSLFPAYFNRVEVLYLFIFAVIGSIFIWRGFDDLGLAEIIMFFGLMFIIAILTVSGVSKINFDNFSPPGSINFFAAFGIFLFALDGRAAIFILKNILTRNRKSIVASVILSYVIVLAIYLIFSLVIIGVLGDAVQEEGIIGIGSEFGFFVEKLVIFFGIMGIFSSYIVVGSNVKSTLLKDFKVPHILAWLIVWLLPFSAYVFGIKSFTALISLLGVVMVSVNTLVITILLKKAKKYGKREPEFTLKFPFFLNYIIVAIYFAAMIYEILLFID